MCKDKLQKKKLKRLATLRPAHYKYWYPRSRILDMEEMEITLEQRQAMSEFCLGVFADMANYAAPLQEILMACYMSGVQHTLSTLAQKEASP